MLSFERVGGGYHCSVRSPVVTFARSVGYEKLVIYVRASNRGAQKFYTELGLSPCGLLARQVKIDGAYDNEIVMEMRL